MEGYINVKFFWGKNEKVIGWDDEIRYCTDPKAMLYSTLGTTYEGTTYEEFKAIVYEVMKIIPYYCNVKMSYRYPPTGIVMLLRNIT